jgi:hypothetical protein
MNLTPTQIIARLDEITAEFTRVQNTDIRVSLIHPDEVTTLTHEFLEDLSPAILASVAGYIEGDLDIYDVLINNDISPLSGVFDGLGRYAELLSTSRTAHEYADAAESFGQVLTSLNLIYPSLVTEDVSD